MYAIIRSGGKQSKVSPGDIVDVERLKSAGDEVEFTPLLVVGEDGTAVTDRAELGKITVRAKVLGEVKGDKIDIFKYKNKSGNRRRQGHRQRYTQLEITAIDMPGAKKAETKKAETKKAETKKSGAKKVEATKAEDSAGEEE